MIEEIINDVEKLAAPVADMRDPRAVALLTLLRRRLRAAQERATLP